MLRTNPAVTALALAMLVAVPVQAAAPDEGCTAAVVATKASADGAPMLWKNRDTGALSNKLLYVDEDPYDYLCLANADADSGRQCFAGLNAAGFGIINTVAYNLPEESGGLRDLEGFIMADALRTCRSTDDFRSYLDANLGPDLGSLATFGVVGDDGAARLFEVHNHGLESHDPAATDDGYLVVTNFARSGEPDQGAGYLRFERATELFAELPRGGIEPAPILSRMTRDLGHTLLDHPESLSELAQLPSDRDRWISTKDCINKSYTSAAVIIVGRRPDDPSSRAMLWIVPGEPITAVALPLWVEAGSSPEPLWAGKEAPLWRESLRIKTLARPFTVEEKERYLNLTRLDNTDGTGFLPTLLRTEAEILAAAQKLPASDPTPAELAAFQDEMAARALEVMRRIE